MVYVEEMQKIIKEKNLINILKEKGFTKHAALLEANPFYLLALSQKEWKKEVSETFGDIDLGYEIENHFDYSTNYPQSPLEIIANTKPITEKTLAEVDEKYFKLKTLIQESDDIIYQDFSNQENDILIRAYRDSYISKTEFSSDEINEEMNSWKNIINEKLSRYELHKVMNAPDIILASDLRNLYSKISIEENNKELEEFLNKDFSIDENEEELTEWINKNDEKIINTTKYLLSNPNEVKDLIEKKHQSRYQNRDQKALEIANDNIKRILERNHLDYEIDSKFFSKEQLFINLETEDSLYDQILPEDQTKIYKAFMKLPIKNRENILKQLNYDLDDFKNHIVGLEEIIEGGQVRNPNVDELSILQNHANYPNINYSQEVKEKLQSIASKMRELYETFPEIEDFPLSKKLRKQKDLTYIMKEMPKNPLDITFGNESGCCLFVDDDANEIQNGTFLPNYLLDPSIRLFGLYKKEKSGKEKRMGFVLGYTSQESSYKDDDFKPFIRLLKDKDSNKNEFRNILALNSLELSRRGIVGGQETIKEITNYVEEWFREYAKINNYDTVLMGNHSYNTSRNYSKHSNQTFPSQVKMKFCSKFYSDIINFNDENSNLGVIKPNTTYRIK